MPLRFFSAARGVHITLSRFRVKRLFSLFSVRFWSEPRCPGGLYAVVPCQWWRIIGSYFCLTRGNLK
ncbi:hypothetical protein DTS43_21395 [Salmonella enterica]|uniref:Uncharacterized protein n=3 Tax=Salmonella enterica TaxID=28901 RepID=A0A6D2DB65_SALET|nr:hypothetical protein LFZ23_20635 [Salmonella enterica subsp. enterica serovar Koessen str. S-1501]ASD88748.1 hypothetical protein LFZ16_22370 [Salmonella enterica subsp. enterica serovar India str. SA20085604]EAP3094685.1 hypothetical protein [Salmonella enterica]EBV9536989.1 hypothetical protein [Salmonella enterica subsp. enterica serovar Durban]EBW3083634.1 hypothetical protein [Salmonella enterica subsp. enterica serovar Gueuletapee]EBX0086353.1 hypothetical protein [Salmonella enterica